MTKKQVRIALLEAAQHGIRVFRRTMQGAAIRLNPKQESRLFSCEIDDQLVYFEVIVKEVR
jgi:hypothetical protein